MGFKSVGKYVFKKISKSIIGRGAKWAFWGLLCFYGPGPVIAAVGVNGLLAGAAVTHSGIIEYSAGKLIDKSISVDE